jgi:AcrR family transcriptional regulator
VETRRLTQRGEERRLQILARSAELFARSGYHPTSVADIVRECGVGKGVFYWYFESKEELFTEIIRANQLALRKHQARMIGNETDPLKRIEAGIYATMTWLAANRHVFALFQFAAAESLFAHLITDGAEVGVADTMRHVKDGIACGQIHDGDPLMIATAVIGVTNALSRRFLSDPESSEEKVLPEAVAAEATTFILFGLASASQMAGSSRLSESIDSVR